MEYAHDVIVADVVDKVDVNKQSLINKYCKGGLKVR